MTNGRTRDAAGHIDIVSCGTGFPSDTAILALLEEADAVYGSRSLMALCPVPVKSTRTIGSCVRKDAEEALALAREGKRVVVLASGDALYHGLGGTLAAQHLHKKGCKRLLHIAGPLTDRSLLGHGRYFGFKNYCEKNGIEVVTCSTENHFSVEYYREFILSNVHENLSSFDGAFCSNDLIAFALCQILREQNISVPEAFKVVGFDNTIFTKTVSPKLTTVAQNIPLIAENLVETLLEMQKGGSPERGVIKLNVQLIQGETT